MIVTTIIIPPNQTTERDGFMSMSGLTGIFGGSERGFIAVIIAIVITTTANDIAIRFKKATEVIVTGANKSYPLKKTIKIA